MYREDSCREKGEKKTRRVGTRLKSVGQKVQVKKKGNDNERKRGVEYKENKGRKSGRQMRYKGKEIREEWNKERNI